MRSIDANARTPLHLAAQSDRTLDALNELLQSSQSALESRDVFGMTPLALAAFHGNQPALIALAAAGADLQTRTDDGASLLHLAAYNADEQALAWLVAHGARLDACDRWGRRPLDVVLVSHRFAYGDSLLKHRLATLLGGSETDVAQKGAFDRHPLHVAIAGLDLGAVTHLLEIGNSPNLRDASGETALRFAIDNHDGPSPMVPRERRAFARKLLPLLIRHGADLTQRTPGSMLTYREHAENRGIGRVIDRLIRRFGEPASQTSTNNCASSHTR